MRVRKRTRLLAQLSMLLAMIVVLSVVEHALPPLPFLPPGMRLGLANIVTMYALFFLGWKHAAGLNVLKALFVLITRGVTAGLLSLCGGLASIGLILLLVWLSHNRFSYLVLSVFGAIGHNLGQLAMASAILGANILLYYLPVLLVAGVILGGATGTLLRVTMPVFRRIFRGGNLTQNEEIQPDIEHK